ncbi:MAG: MarR family winged helix-turn-helix transcriptional regulator [Verrucomicrobiales bacterium]|nr:MarR family winged helix-turn-helix transcriptional regulator [Verrucomicrobiales bacterium]
MTEPTDLRDDFPDTPARRAVVSVVRSFGALTRLMGPHYASFNLTPPQFQMLTILNRLRGERITQRRLGRELYVSFPNVTVMLSRIETAGLIERKVNPADRRERFVRITPAGLALLKRIWKVQPMHLEHVTAGLTDPERIELARLLNKMIAGLPPATTEEEAIENRSTPEP